jgi:phage tail sheath gpL-like
MNTAVGSERVSKVVGYKIKKGNFSNTTPNLPQSIAVLAEANNANQSGLSTTAQEITSAKQAGDLYGYGSPIYQIMRILKPISGEGVGGIPIYVYPQAEAAGATAKILQIVASGTATESATHIVKVAGRNGVDGQTYEINISAGDTASVIHGKIAAAVNGVLGSPVTAVSFGYDVDLTSKWKGLTANDLTVTVETDNKPAGVTYTITSPQNAVGTPSVQAALDQFGSEWKTIVINSYGLQSTVMDTLEDFNGTPSATSPTGRYTGTIVKPFVALSGSVSDDPSATTDARPNEVTIVVCPAPLSKGLPMEAAANACVLYARQAQDEPHLDISGKAYPDMPTPTSIGSMASYDNRDTIVQKGCSTVDLVAGQYVVQDFVTTYHPTGELPPQFRYVRNLNIDLNIKFGYYLLEQAYVVDHVIAADADSVSASKVVKPKTWIAQVSKYAEDLGSRALIADVPFMQDNIEVSLSTTNPDRLETTFKYKRSGFARIASTEVEAGFNLG